METGFLPARFLPAIPGTRLNAPHGMKNIIRYDKTPGPDGQSVFGVADYSAAFAFSQSEVKAAASWMAISESILRFKVTPAFFRPFMKVE